MTPNGWDNVAFVLFILCVCYTLIGNNNKDNWRR